MKTVLVVDDEPRIVELARDYLEHSGFAVITAVDGPSALTAARVRKPDVLVLDLGLPGMDGLDVARAIRRDSTMPIIMLTARDDELDRVLGLEIGAVTPGEIAVSIVAELIHARRSPLTPLRFKSDRITP